MSDDESARAIDEFWQVARVKARLSTLGGVLSETPLSAVAPPAWSFGDGPALADELLGLVLSGTKTATASLVVEFEAASEPLPAAGELSIVLDGTGAPRALIRTAQVSVVPFSEVTAEHAYLEGEGPRTLEAWRVDHERYWRRNLPDGVAFSPGLLVVCERFTVLYATS